MATPLKRRGFSVLEMLVATTLMLLVLAIASQLLLDAQASIANSGRLALDMSVDLAFDQLRADIRNSIGHSIPPGMGDLWARDEPLSLYGHTSGDTIVYDLVDEDLVRSVYRPGVLEPAASRIVLRRIRTFRWRNQEGTTRPALQLEVRHAEAVPLRRRTAAGQREADDEAIRTVSLVIAPRQMDIDQPTAWW